MSANLDSIVDALAHLICADTSNKMFTHDVDPRSIIPPGWFDGFEPLVPDDATEVLVQDNLLDLPVWPIDVCIASQETGEGWQPGAWQFSRVRTLDRKAWRGALRMYLPRMVELGVCISEPAGWRQSALVPLGLTKSGPVDCRALSQRGMRIDIAGGGDFSLRPEAYSMFKPRGLDQDAQWLTLSGGFALRRRYFWSVLIGEGTGPRARFITDIVGAREAFRLRDFPEGKARRAALRHWVREHWRKRRAEGASDRAWVKQHLRGATRFRWGGLNCEMIEPAIIAEAAA